MRKCAFWISYVINFNVDASCQERGLSCGRGWKATARPCYLLHRSRMNTSPPASEGLSYIPGFSPTVLTCDGKKRAVLMSKVVGVTGPVGMFVVWLLKSALVWGQGCHHSLAFQAFGKDRLWFSLCLCLLVINWQQICCLMSHTDCYGAWPGALMRQVSGLCWIMQQGSAWTAQCHALALNQGRRDWWGLSEELSNPSIGQWWRSRLSFKECQR